MQLQQLGSVVLCGLMHCPNKKYALNCSKSEILTDLYNRHVAYLIRILFAT